MRASKIAVTKKSKAEEEEEEEISSCVQKSVSRLIVERENTSIYVWIADEGNWSVGYVHCVCVT